VGGSRKACEMAWANQNHQVVDGLEDVHWGGRERKKKLSD